MTEQISLFDGAVKYKITKPIRLIELFGGIGAQSKALERLQVPFTAWRYCEIDKYAVQSYNAVHGTKFAPTDITQLHAEDLAIRDTDKYEHIMTYSFPCQDLAILGSKRGMTKGSGTRSGLLWEVERLLDEMTERPQILLMENVPQVIGVNAIKDFALWLAKLEELGYKNYWRVLNATGFGVPQNRQRCYMVSLLGDYRYSFPKEKPLKKVLLDLLEEKVDEKYYLSDRQLRYVIDYNHVCDNTKRGDLGKFIVNPPIAKTISCRGASSQRADITNFVIEGADRVYTIDDLREMCAQGTAKNLRVRKLTPRECWRLMDFDDEDFDKAKATGISDSQLYKQAGNSIVVAVLQAIFGELI